MAWPTVLQAVMGDVQALLLFPLAPLTYHVVLAIAVEVRPTNTAANRRLVSSLSFMILLFVTHATSVDYKDFGFTEVGATRTATQLQTRLGATTRRTALISAPRGWYE